MARMFLKNTVFDPFSSYLKVTTASHKRAGANHHETDEDLQHDPGDRGSAFYPADTRTRGEEVFPQLVTFIGLS